VFTARYELIPYIKQITLRLYKFRLTEQVLRPIHKCVAYLRKWNEQIVFFILVKHIYIFIYSIPHTRRLNQRQNKGFIRHILVFITVVESVYNAVRNDSLYKADYASSLTFILLLWRIGRAPNSIQKYSYIRQDATSHTLFISGNCSTCFGWYFHPSPGAHTNVSTASGICHTVTTICRYHGRVGTGLSVLWVAYATHSTLKPVPNLPQ
jgi:hypothetical protein